MKRYIIWTFMTAATVSMASAGFAEGASGTPSANANPNMPAVVTNETPAAIEPAAGRNSFTEAQARERLMQNGYTNIGTLRADSNGVWRGTARMKNSSLKVAVDYQGNVTTTR